MDKTYRVFLKDTENIVDIISTGLYRDFENEDEALVFSRQMQGYGFSTVLCTIVEQPKYFDDLTKE